VKCRQLSSFPEDPGLTEFSGRGALDPAARELSGDRGIAPPPLRCAGDESENRRHPAPSGADDFSTPLRAEEDGGEDTGEDKVPRAEAWF
jgi:hypothetical protein